MWLYYICKTETFVLQCVYKLNLEMLLLLIAGWVAVVALNSSVETVGGGIAVLAARVCGHPPPLPSALTWLPPYHLPPIRPGHTRDRLRAHNLTVSVWMVLTGPAVGPVIYTE